jgi:hypothetical protein
MMRADCKRKLEEAERLLNDPDIPFDPAKIWSLLSDISKDNCTLPARVVRDNVTPDEHPTVWPTRGLVSTIEGSGQTSDC